MYYYFYMNRSIMELPYEVNLSINPAFTSLTAEQVEFHTAYPNATVAEVKQCVLYPVPEEPTLEERKDFARDALKEAFREKVRNFDEIDMILAITSRICIQNGWHSEAESPYSTAEARAVICGFVHLGKAAKDALAAGLSAVDAAEDPDALMAAEEAAMAAIGNATAPSAGADGTTEGGL